MSKTPQVIIDAVLQQQEKKRGELATYQADAKAAELALLAAAERVDTVKRELATIYDFLREAGLTERSVEAVQQDAEEEANEPDSARFDGQVTSVSGRPLRKIVAAFALEVAGEKNYFTVDDVMAKLKEKKIMLGVANPRVRTSQVLTLTKGFVYDEDRRSWTRVPHGGEASTSTGGDIDLS
jgi:hypothetical protein